MSFTAEQVLTVALQVWKGTNYHGPADVDNLLTTYLAWIPKDQVDPLSQELLAKNSQFYTAAGLPYTQLAAHVDATFPVSGAVDNGSGGSGGGGSASPADGAQPASASGSSKTREDVIIGVVSSLGAITLLVLAFLLVRALKQRRELAHRRLSDPGQGDMFVGARPDNQEFDRDSVGGQRRRSFYYAEDSLRATEMSAGHEQQMSESGMRERRQVNAGMIGTPVLRDNTMNW